MRRRRTRLQVSTFPFLAVLLCAMGSLILLLLVIDRRAKVVARAKLQQVVNNQAEASAQASHARKAEWDRRRQALHEQLAGEEQLLRQQLQELHNRLRGVTDQKAATHEQDKVLRSRLEAERAALLQKRAELAGRATRLVSLRKQGEASEAERARLTAELEELEHTVADLMEARRLQKKMFSLVPFAGKRGENRQPIYAECRLTEVLFHPDRASFGGLGFWTEDLRREFEKRSSKSAVIVPIRAESEEHRPYVLLLVRPDGITTYYQTTAILQSLKIDFGYELVDADWILDFSDQGGPKQPWLIAGPSTEAIAATPRRATPPARLPSGWGQTGQASSLGTGPGGGSAGPGTGLSLPGSTSARGPSAGANALGADPAAVGPGLFSAGGGGLIGNGLGRPTPLQPPDSPGFGSSGAQANWNGAGVPAGTSHGRSQGVPRGLSHAGEVVEPPFSDLQARGAATLPGMRPGEARQFIGPAGSVGPGTMNGGNSTQAFARPPANGGESEKATLAGPGLMGGPVPDPGQAPATTVVGPGTKTGLPARRAGTQPGSNMAETGAAGTENAASSSGGEGTPASGSREAGAEQKLAANGEAPARAGGDPRGSGEGERGSTAEPGSSDQQGGSEPGRSGRGIPGSAAEGKPRSSPAPVVLRGNRDWPIQIECTDKGIKVPLLRREYTIDELTEARGQQALLSSLRELIARRQATVRAGEPPYRPMVRFGVHARGLRAYHLAYPVLEGLRVGMTRENVVDEAGTKGGVP